MAQKTATIRFDGKTHRGNVRGGVNGQHFSLPVDQDVSVTAAQLQMLRDSGTKFEIVSPLAGEDADEGSSASSTVEGTAVRAEPPASNEADNPALKQGDATLSQRTDEELKQIQAESEKQAQQDTQERVALDHDKDGDKGGSEPAAGKETKPATTKPAAGKKPGATKPKTTAQKKKADK
jgi:hypothetical protein